MVTGSWEADRGPSWVEDVGWVVRGYRQVVAVLDDPAFLVPAVEPDGRGVGWLRGSVSRFANGAEHARRRSQVEGLLGALEPAALRDKAATEARRVLERTAGGVVEVMSALARRVPLLVLARALAVEADTESLVEAIPVVAAAYPPGSTSEREEQADRAVEQLLVELGGRDESTASILAILVQACEANAGLIGNTLDVALRLPPPLPYVDLPSRRHSATGRRCAALGASRAASAGSERRPWTLGVRSCSISRPRIVTRRCSWILIASGQDVSGTTSRSGMAFVPARAALRRSRSPLGSSRLCLRAARRPRRRPSTSGRPRFVFRPRSRCGFDDRWPLAGERVSQAAPRRAAAAAS